MAAFTLAQAKNLSQDKLTNYVIDEFRKSPLLDAMVFDDTVKPQGGTTMTYVYNREDIGNGSRKGTERGVHTTAG